MTVKTYVLIETQPGMTNTIVNKIRELKGVLSADTVTGLYDAIAVIEGETLTEIGSIETAMTTSISDITRTVICVAVEL